MSSQFTFEAIGTGWVIDIWQEISKAEEEDILLQIKNRIDVFDKDYSRFRPDSLVVAMSEKAGEYVMPDDAQEMISLYHELFLLTGGLFTPLIGQVMVDSGYDAVYTLKQTRELKKPPAWDDVLNYSHPHLTIKEPVLLDFGAAGKGYLIDIVGKVLEQNNIHNFCIDAGGDILHRREDGTSLKIGLENPEDFNQVVGVCNLSNRSLCGSAGSRRKWSGMKEEFHHIIDPFKLSSPKEIIATWVVSDTTLLADALATSLFFVPPEKLSSQYANRYNWEYVIIYSDYSVAMSDSFPGEVFTKNI